MKKLPSLYPWEPIRCSGPNLLSYLQNHRSDETEVQFFYGGYVHEMGVSQKDGKTAFYLDDDVYSSLYIFMITAQVDDMLFPDLTDPVLVLAVNGSDPSNCGLQ